MGHWSNSPTLETTGRLSGSRTARTSTLFSVSLLAGMVGSLPCKAGQSGPGPLHEAAVGRQPPCRGSCPQYKVSRQPAGAKYAQYYAHTAVAFHSSLRHNVATDCLVKTGE